MTLRERERLHQLHPAKLLVDWCTAAVGCALFWSRQPVAALLVGFAPSLATTLLFLSGAFDSTLDRIRRPVILQAIAWQLSTDVNTIRFAGLALAWIGCWFHRPWLVPGGVLVILGGWWLAWRRGQRRGAF
jgi:hypothetical protein